MLNVSGFHLKGIGTNSAAPVLFVVGIRDSICEKLNYNLYGSSDIPMGAFASFGAPATVVLGATVNNPMSNLNYVRIGVSYKGWMKGCLSMEGKPDSNFYFHILQAL